MSVMATVRIYAADGTKDFLMLSRWEGGTAGKFKSGPTWGGKTLTFKYDLPSGAVIRKSQIWATIGSIYTGWSYLGVNGSIFTEKYNKEQGANVSLNSVSGSLDAMFSFKANGKNDGKDGSSSVQFTDVYLWIEYDEPAYDASEADEQAEDPADVFSIPPQSVCMYDQETGLIYMFDGVTKIQHVMSVKIEEEPSKHQDEFVNNARNEPDKVILDVLMSDVYSDNGYMTIASGWDDAAQSTYYEKTKSSVISDFTRSGNAVYVLRRLKEARKKLTVITPQYVHIDMILGSITINQDDTCPYGWQGQIEFQHAYAPKKKKENDYSSNKEETLAPTESVGAQAKGEGNVGSGSGSGNGAANVAIFDTLKSAAASLSGVVGSLFKNKGG